MIEFTDVPRPNSIPLEWFGDLKPNLVDNYLIKGVISAGSMSVVYGPSNSGKTFFALDLAYRVAAGVYWQGRRVKRGAVLYLAAEGGSGIVNRIVALRDAHRGANPNADDVPLAVRRGAIAMLGANDDADIAEIVACAAEVREKSGLEPEGDQPIPLLIIVDTLSRAFSGGDENSSVDMTRFVGNVDAIRKATGAHVMIVHHTGKDVARGARGHSSLRASTDTEIEVEAMSGGGHAAHTKKQRDYAGGETFTFALKQVPVGVDSDGDEITTCIVAPLEEVNGDAEPGRPKASDAVLQRAMEEIILAVDMAEATGYPLTFRGLEDMQFSVGKRAVRELSRKAYELGLIVQIGSRCGGVLLGVPKA